jgi:hypothetical protein
MRRFVIVGWPRTLTGNGGRNERLRRTTDQLRKDSFTARNTVGSLRPPDRATIAVNPWLLGCMVFSVWLMRRRQTGKPLCPGTRGRALADRAGDLGSCATCTPWSSCRTTVPRQLSIPSRLCATFDAVLAPGAVAVTVYPQPPARVCGGRIGAPEAPGRNPGSLVLALLAYLSGC